LIRTSRSVLACLAALTLATGCTSVVTGTVRPAVGLKPRPVTGQTVKRVLLDEAALSKLLDQSFTAKSELPPRFGGPETLQRAFGLVTPEDCVGVVTMLEKRAYRSAQIENVARETWWNARGLAKVIDVAEGVVALSTASEAAALFAKFSAQWERCDGTTVTLDAGKIVFSDKVSEVRVTNSVLAATLSIATRMPGAPSSGSRPVARAIGVRGNCLVEVDVAFFSTRRPSDRGTGDLDTTAIDIAHAMMEKVSALS